MSSSPVISAWTLPKANSREGEESALFKIWAAEALKDLGAALPLSAAVSNKPERLDDRTVAILESRAWEAALLPVKSMGMNLFMLWLMGSGAGIFTILLVAYAVIQAVEMLFRVESTFSQYKGADTLILQKVTYLTINILIIGYLGNKAGNMGLLPIASGDWISLFPQTVILEQVRSY
jgi:Protein of unknown function (DUF1077)